MFKFRFVPRGKHAPRSEPPLRGWLRRLNDDGTRRTIRLSSDYTAGPLWDMGLVQPSDYDLSDELTARLHAWQDYFDAHYHWERGWDAQESADQWFAEAEPLRAALVAEVSDFADVIVTLDKWPERGPR